MTLSLSPSLAPQHFTSYCTPYFTVKIYEVIKVRYLSGVIWCHITVKDQTF